MTHPCYSVFREFPVCPLHHLVAVVIREQSPVVLEGGAGPEDDLCVEKERTQRVGLLQSAAPRSGPKVFGDTGGDRVSIVFIAVFSRKQFKSTNDQQQKRSGTVKQTWIHAVPPTCRSTVGLR